MAAPHPSSSTLFPYTTLFRSPLKTIFASGSRAGFEELALNVRLAAGFSASPIQKAIGARSEEYTTELQSPYEMVCGELVAKKNMLKPRVRTLLVAPCPSLTDT